MSAQCTLSCPSGLNLSIAGPDYGCESVLTPVDIGVIAPSCTGLMDLDLYTLANQLLAGDTTVTGARTGVVTSVQIGMQLRARITHRATGNNCDINLTIVDGLAPVLEITDTTVSILQSILPQGFGGAFEGPFIEDCTTTTSFYTDSVAQVECGGSAYAKTYRTWTVIDAFSKSSTISQVISQMAVQLDSIETPIDTSISCVEGIPTDISMGTPRVNFGSEVYTLPSLSGNHANLFWSYTDESFAGGGGTAQLLRSFRFYDACSPAVVGVNPRTLVQRISVIDTVAPVISTLQDTLYYSTSTTDCQSVVSLPALIVADDCTSVPSVTVQLNGQFISTNGGFYGPLALGTYTAVYTATDLASNASVRSLVVIVRDQNPPVLVTKSELQVSLPSNGEAVILPENFDQGSYDDCSNIDWSIRVKNEATWATSLLFDCQFLDQDVVVEIRACDQFGNCNTRDAIVNTFDYLSPVISAPPSLSFSCAVSDADLALFGDVFIADNCDFIVSDSIAIDRDQCGVGEIRRYWVARDSSDNESSGQQVISFVPDFTFSASDIEWPRDTSLSVCQSTDPLQMSTGVAAPLWSAVACSDIAVGYDDQVMTGPSGVCEVLFRTWTVIDQCSFDGLSAGIWTHEQHIQRVDVDVPVITSVADTVEVFTTIDSCSGGFFPASVFDVQDCGVVQSEIRFYDDSQVLIELPFLDTVRFIPKRANKVELIAVDNCGNKDSLSVVISVIDQSPPVAFCVDTLTYYLQEDSLALDASLLDLGSRDACGELLLNITTDFIPSCDSIGWNTVELVVTDSAGLQDVCFTEVEVIDTSSVCKLKSTTVYGKMATVNGHSIPTRFDLVGMVGDTVATILSDADGVFSFEVDLVDSVTILPSSTYDPALFISTYDLYLIGQHVLGVTEFTDPLKRFAGDANRSRSISAFDMTLLRRLFLGLSDALPHGNSVRFIPDTADLTLPDVELTPGIPMSHASDDSTRLSWHSIKLGDVSGTRTLYSTAPLVSRTEARLSLEWTEIEDGLWTLKYVGAEALDLYGLSLWLNSSAVRMDKVFREGLLTAETGRGTAMSWLAGAVPLSLKQGTRILTVSSNAYPEIDLIKSDAVLGTVSEGVPNEYAISISVNEAAATEAKALRVYPNPAKAGTMLRVSSERMSITSLHLVDARGVVTELSVESGLDALGLLPSTLAPGIYALQGRYNDGRTFEQRILVSN
ncbi:MAG: hypothetical protein AB8F78_19540 [Saprospiraceae bacterium]